MLFPYLFICFLLFFFFSLLFVSQQQNSKHIYHIALLSVNIFSFHFHLCYMILWEVYDPHNNTSISKPKLYPIVDIVLYWRSQNFLPISHLLRFHAKNYIKKLKIFIYRGMLGLFMGYFC